MTRAVSLLLAFSTSMVLMTVPFVVARHLDGAAHGLLSLMMLGITGAFVHGVGFVPRRRALRWLFSPALSWSLLLGAGAFLLLA